MPHWITQSYLPPGRGSISRPSLSPAMVRNKINKMFFIYLEQLHITLTASVAISVCILMSVCLSVPSLFLALMRLPARPDAACVRSGPSLRGPLHLLTNCLCIYTSLHYWNGNPVLPVPPPLFPENINPVHSSLSVGI